MPPIDFDVQRLCLLRMSALGDLVQVWAAANAIRRRHPRAELTWIIGRPGRQLLAAAEGIRFIEFDRSAGIGAYRALRQALGQTPFDVLLMMQPTLRANLMTPLIPARLKIGYDFARARELNWLVTNHRLPAAARQHHALNFFDFARALDCYPQEDDFRLPVLPAAREKAAALMPETTRGWVILHPAASNPARNWLMDRYIALAGYAHDCGFRVALTGGQQAAERALCDRIAREARGDVVDFSGQLGLQELVAVLERARLVVAPDTGPAHMAAAQGTPVIGLYAASNPYCTGPLQSLDWVANRYPDALYQATGKSVDAVSWGYRVRRGDPMALITLEEVKALFDRAVLHFGW